MRIKNFISTMLLLIIFAFIFSIGYFFFSKLFIKTDLEFASKMTGAFAGAFFAFLFVRIGDALTRFYDRQKKSYNGLVRLEYLCNEYLNRISDNVFIIDDFSKIATDSMAKNEPFIYMNTLHEFIIPKDILLDLANIDLINEVFSFYADTEKMNHSIATVNRFYSEIKDAFVQQKIDYGTYKTNVSIGLAKMTELRKFLLGLDQETKKMASTTRLLSKDKPFLTYLIHLSSREYLSKRIKNKVPSEIKKLEAEIEATKARSSAEIAIIHKNF